MCFRYSHVHALIYDFNYSYISCAEESVRTNYFPQTGYKYNATQKVQTENEYNSSGEKERLRRNKNYARQNTLLY